jgi:hypothetical protein
MSGVQFAQNLKTELDHGNPNTLGDVVRKIKMGTMLNKVKIAFTSLTTATAHNITDAAHAAHGSPAPDADTEPAAAAYPPIGQIVALRDTGGATGVYVAGDSGCTPFDASGSHPGVVALSDDGKTITFNTTTTGFVLEYYPAPDSPMSTAFAVD